MARSDMAPAWRRAFLRELARSGNVALAVEKCGIHHTNGYRERAKNPAFAASWDRALAAARERLGPGGSQAHPRPLPQAGGESRRPRPKLRANEIVRAS